MVVQREFLMIVINGKVVQLNFMILMVLQITHSTHIMLAPGLEFLYLRILMNMATLFNYNLITWN